MGTSVSLNGVSYTIPAVGESAWGTQVRNYLIAQATGLLSKAGGSFTLTAESDFGGDFGLKAISYKSRGTVSSAGVFRLANAESIGWRNAANGADKLLKVNASDILEFGGNPVVTLALGTANYALKMNSGGTAYEWGLLANANIDASAAIAYSKLNLTTSILDGDINASAAIARSKIASGTADHVLINSGAGAMSSEAALSPVRGGTGVANNAAATLTRSGNHALTFTTTGTTGVTLPTSGTLATLAGSETFTNKVLSGNTATNLISGSGTATLNTSGTVTLPNATDTLVGKATTDVLTNKTLTGNIAVNLVSGAATVTLPTTTSSLATLALAETWTNKTLTSPIFGTSAVFKTGAEARFYDADDSNYVGFKAPSLAANKIWVLPDADGGANAVLKTDGAGNLGWAAVASTVTTTRGDLIRRGASADERFAAVTNNRVVRGDGTDVVLGQIDDPGFFTTGAAADGTHIGIVTTGSQTFGGTKTFVAPVLGAATATSINFGGGALDTFVPWTTFTPTLTKNGGSGTLTSSSTQFARYSQIGKIVSIEIYISAITIATSGITLKFNLPVGARNGSSILCHISNNGTQAVGRLTPTGGGSQNAVISSTVDGGLFNVGASSEFDCTVTYEAN